MVNIVTPVGRPLLFTPFSHASGRNASKVAHVDIKAKLVSLNSRPSAALYDPCLRSVANPVLEVNNVKAVCILEPVQLQDDTVFGFAVIALIGDTLLLDHLVHRPFVDSGLHCLPRYYICLLYFVDDESTNSGCDCCEGFE